MRQWSLEIDAEAMVRWPFCPDNSSFSHMGQMRAHKLPMQEPYIPRPMTTRMGRTTG